MGHQVIGKDVWTIPVSGAEKSVCGDFACSGKTVRFRTRVPILNLIVLVSTISPQSLKVNFDAPCVPIDLEFCIFSTFMV